MEDLRQDEYVIFKNVQANWLRKFEGVGGKLYLTNQRLIFVPHGLNIQTDWVQMELWGTTKIEKHQTLGIIPNGIKITMDSGEVVKFIVWNRSKIIREIIYAKRTDDIILK